MSKLIYKTIGNIKPDGKQKVYLICHPQDRQSYLEKIVSQILKYKDCAIWMDEEEFLHHDFSEKELELREMQVVVFAVSRWLFDSEKMLNSVIEICNNNKIPMFPIVIEKNIQSILSLFGEKFGDIQYLHIHQNSETEIDYEKKLEKHINTLFVEESIHEKIRNCFDANVFLSYRKKDRYDANRLMDLIHENEQYSNIAFWYDEFLITGENYNESIQEKIEKCDFMMLAVTPNILEAGNYVLTKEVPYARDDANKTILPIEMQTTNRNDFERMYAGIEECIEVQDKEGVYRKIDEILKCIGIEKREKTTEELYYIALAYLDGVDVKPDMIKGARMVEKIATSGYVPAMQKMHELYKFGKGVEVDKRKSVEWKVKVVETYRTEVFMGNRSWNDLWGELWLLGEAYESLNQKEDAKACYLEMLDLIYKNNNGRQAVSFMYTFDLLGGIEFDKMNYEAALKWYEKSEQVYLGQRRAAEQGDFTVMFILPLLDDIAKVFCQKLGTIYNYFGDYEKAERYFSFYGQATQQKVDRGETLKGKREKVLSYTNKASVCVQKGEFLEANNLYVIAYEMCEELSQYAEDEEILRYKAAILQSWSIVEIAMGDISSGVDKVKKAIMIAIKIIEDYGIENIIDFLINTVDLLEVCHRDYMITGNEYDILNSICRTCEKVNATEFKNGNKEKAVMLQAHFVDLSEVCANKCRDIGIWSIHGIACGMLADLFMSINMNNAKLYYEKELKMYERIFEYNNTKFIYESIAGAHYSLAKCTLGNEKGLHLGYAADMYMKLYQNYPQDPHYQEMILKIASENI